MSILNLRRNYAPIPPSFLPGENQVLPAANIVKVDVKVTVDKVSKRANCSVEISLGGMFALPPERAAG